MRDRSSGQNCNNNFIFPGTEMSGNVSEWEEKGKKKKGIGGLGKKLNKIWDLI